MNVQDKTTAFGVAAIEVLARKRQHAEVWRDDQGLWTWAEFGRAVEATRLHCIEAGVEAGQIVVLPAEATVESLAWLFGVASLGLVAAPLRLERNGELPGWKKFLRLEWQVRAGRIERLSDGEFSPAATALLDELQARRHPGLILATGGTTGTPKVLLHDLEALLATVIVKESRPRRTLPLMRFDHIGGLDMAWRALASGQILVAPPADLKAESIAATVARHRVEILPATPSLLNLMLLAGVQEKYDLSSLQVIPFGAEPMPDGLLARLEQALPGVQFVQRFGTTETGALPVGNIAGRLVLVDEAFAWKVVNGELWVKSPARALGYLTGDARTMAEPGWFQTGDLAEQLPDGSLQILGRRDELINVGGEKVLPAGVESVLLAHPDVADCRVMAVPNVVLGQVVGAEIVWRGEQRDPLAVKRALHDFARTRLPRFHLPTVVRLVDAIATTRNLKKARINP